MTSTPDRAALVATVEIIAAQLVEAEQNAALLQRLKTAEADVKRLTAELREAQDDLANASAAELETRREAAFAKFRDIAVIESGTEHLLHRNFAIKVTTEGHNGFEEGRWTSQYPSFAALPDDAFRYLVERHPDRIPASITGLAPGDPWQAFRVYFAGKQRGYFNAPAAA